MNREYRAVKCNNCIWQDFYEVGKRPSYPPRCPRCGSGCDHEFFVADFTALQRHLLGRDHGSRTVFGDPRFGYRAQADRRGVKLHEAGKSFLR